MVWLKRIALAFLILLVLTLSVGTWMGWHYRDRFVPIAIQQLNTYLATPIHVESIELSFLERFPHASIRLNKVSAKGSNPNLPNDTLFYFEKVYLSFNTFDLYYGRYTLQSLEANTGFWHMCVDENGFENYRFLKTESDSSASNFIIDLERVKLVDTHFSTQDKRFGQHIDFQVHSALAKGHFSNQESNTALYGNFRVNQVAIAGENYMQNEALGIDAGLEFNLETGFYRLSRGKIILRDKYNSDVWAQFSPGEYALKLSSEKIDLQALRSLLPQSLLGENSNVQMGGNTRLNFSAELKKGELFPAIELEAHIHNGKLTGLSTFGKLENISASLRYNNGKERKAQSSNLQLENLELDWKKSHVEGDFQLRNFDKKVFQFKGNAKLDAEETMAFLELDSVLEVKGEVFAKLIVSGAIKEDFSAKDIVDWDKKLELKCEKLKAKYQTHALNLDKLSLEVNGNHLLVSEFIGEHNKAKMQLSGSSKNFVRHLFLDHPEWHFDGELKTTRLHVDDFLSNDESASSANSILPHIHLNLVADELTFQNYQAKLVEAEFLLQNQSVLIPYFELHAFEGKLEGRGKVEMAKQWKYALACKGSNINIQTLFKKFDNFGQSAISHENLKGISDFDAHVYFEQNQANKEISLPSLKVQSEVWIKNGEIIEYKPLYSLVSDIKKSSWLMRLIKLDDFEKRLHHVKFQELYNQIEVKDQKVFFPKMSIFSTALDLGLEGWHSFDNFMDYHISFNLKQVLLRKLEEKQELEHGYVLDDGTGNKMIFLHVSGHVDNPDVKLDKAAGKAHQKKAVNEEVKISKSILKEEFGLFKNDTSLKALPKPEEKRASYEVDLGEFGSPDKKEDLPKDTLPEKRWKKAWKKLGGDENKSKFEEWEFEEDDL